MGRGCLRFGVSRVGGGGVGIADTAVAVSGEGAEVYPQRKGSSLTWSFEARAAAASAA